MKYDDFWKGLQVVCPDVDVARAKKLCDGMVDVFVENYRQGGLKPRELSLAVAIAVLPMLDILNADREKALGVLCELLHMVSKAMLKQGSKEN